MACTYTVKETGQKLSENEFKAYLLNGGLQSFVDATNVSLPDIENILDGSQLRYLEEVKDLAAKIKKDELLYSDVIKNRSQDFIDELNRQLKGSSKFNVDEIGFKSFVKRQKDFGLTKEEILAEIGTTKKVTKRIAELVDEVFGNDAMNDAAIAELNEAFKDLSKGQQPKRVLQRLANSDITHLVSALKDALTYQTVSNKQLEDIADYIIATIDINDAQEVLAKMSYNNLGDVKQILRAKLINALDAAGNTELAEQLTADMADEATVSGRQTQSLKKAYEILGTKGSPRIKTAYQRLFIEKANELAEKKVNQELERFGAKDDEIEQLNKKIHELTQKSDLISKIKDVIGKICDTRRKQ